MARIRKTWPTNDQLLANMREVYECIGHLTYWLYKEQGDYSCTTVEKRFGSWNTACELAGIKPGIQEPKTKPKVQTWCLVCEKTFARPADDPSCRLCAICVRNRYGLKPVEEGWELIAP